jgi:hypothetical protein
MPRRSPPGVIQNAAPKARAAHDDAEICKNSFIGQEALKTKRGAKSARRERETTQDATTRTCLSGQAGTATARSRRCIGASRVHFFRASTQVMFGFH